MKLLKTTIVILLLVFSLGCDRGYDDRNIEYPTEVPSSSNPENIIPESTAELQLDSTDIENSNDISKHDDANRIQKEESEILSTQGKSKENTLDDNDENWYRGEIGLLISILLNLFLLVLFIRLFRKNTSLNNDIDEKNVKLNNKNWKIKELERDLQLAISKKNNQFQQDRKQKETNERRKFQNNGTNPAYVEEKSYEVVLDHKTPSSSSEAIDTVPKVILYAGKPSDANTFSAVSREQDEHRSIFKLILENKNADTAKFEVIENEYILKMAANSPDTYLYHICKPENSNQNFDGRIVTTAKGTAHLVDGKWKVNDHEKATIKFQ